MVTKLTVVAGGADKTEVDLSPPAVIGRSRKADITIAHPLVSRRHCEIVVGEDGRLVVRDLGSLNGTFVGKTRIDGEAVLEPGSLLTVGSVTFRATSDDLADKEESLTTPAAESEDVLDFIVDEDEAGAEPADAAATPKTEEAAEEKVAEEVDEPIDETIDFEFSEVSDDDGADVIEAGGDQDKTKNTVVEVKPTDSGEPDDDGFDLAWLEEGDD